jgi:hypothetical protein
VLAVADYGLHSAVKTAVACARASIEHIAGLRGDLDTLLSQRSLAASLQSLPTIYPNRRSPRQMPSLLAVCFQLRVPRGVPLKIVLSSLYLQGSLATLKFASFYAQQIVIRRSFAGMLTPTGEQLPGGLETGVVSEAYYTLPEAVEAKLRPLISEGVAIVDSEQSPGMGEPPEQFENAFDSIRDTIFQSNSANGVLYALRPELNLIAEGSSPCTKLAARERLTVHASVEW